MNKYRLSAALLLGFSVANGWCAPPIEFQTVARNSSGDVLADMQAYYRISVLESPDAAESLYSETHVATSDSTGRILIHIGEGDNPSSDFDAIDWSDTRYLRLEADIDGAGFKDYGISTILGAPVAVSAGHADRIVTHNSRGDWELTVTDSGQLEWKLQGNSGTPAYDLTLVPDQLYLIGNFIGDNGWDVSQAELMTKLSDTRFTLTRHLEPGYIFKFVSRREWGGRDWSAQSCNIGTPNPMRELDNTPEFTGTPGTYQLTVDFYTYTLTIAAK